jgi:hypothetical protein
MACARTPPVILAHGFGVSWLQTFVAKRFSVADMTKHPAIIQIIVGHDRFAGFPDQQRM